MSAIPAGLGIVRSLVDRLPRIFTGYKNTILYLLVRVRVHYCWLLFGIVGGRRRVPSFFLRAARMAEQLILTCFGITT